MSEYTPTGALSAFRDVQTRWLLQRGEAVDHTGISSSALGWAAFLRARMGRFPWLTRMNAVALNAKQALTREGHTRRDHDPAVEQRSARKHSLVRRLTAQQMARELPYLTREQFEELGDAIDAEPTPENILASGATFIHTYPDGTDHQRAFVKKVWSIEPVDWHNEPNRVERYGG